MKSKIDEKYIEEVIISQSNSENFEDQSNSMELELMNISDDKNTNITNIDNTVFKAPYTSIESVTNNLKNVNSTDVSDSTILRVSKVSWSDPRTFPPKADILIGSDLVYDSKILTLLTQAVDGMLAAGNFYIFNSFYAYFLFYLFFIILDYITLYFVLLYLILILIFLSSLITDLFIF